MTIDEAVEMLRGWLDDVVTRNWELRAAIEALLAERDAKEEQVEARLREVEAERDEFKGKWWPIIREWLEPRSKDHNIALEENERLQAEVRALREGEDNLIAGGIALREMLNDALTVLEAPAQSSNSMKRELAQKMRAALARQEAPKTKHCSHCNDTRHVEVLVGDGPGEPGAHVESEPCPYCEAEEGER